MVAGRQGRRGARDASTTRRAATETPTVEVTGRPNGGTHGYRTSTSTSTGPRLACSLSLPLISFSCYQGVLARRPSKQGQD